MISYPDLHLYINGKWRKSTSDLPVLNPATEEEIGRLPNADKNDLDEAITTEDELSEIMGLRDIVDGREVACYSISAKNNVNIDRTLEWLIG